MTNPTGAPRPRFAADDPRSAFAAALGTAADVVERVRPADLDRPTPCTSYDVRALLGHLVAVVRRTAAIGQGLAFDAVPQVVTGVADDGWATALEAAQDEAWAVWSDDAVLDRFIELPWIQAPGRIVLATYLNEVTVHTWDLATACGLGVEWDAGVVEAAMAAITVGLPAEGRAEHFEAAKAVMPPGWEPPFTAAVEIGPDAPAIDRLVAWNGRDPR